MRFLAVDDEPLLLNKLVDVLKKAEKDAEVLAFTWPDEALEAVKTQPCDVAFLDIQMGEMSGLELAVRLKKLKPDIHIVFVTGYQEYAIDAFAIHATGYLLKPVDEAAVKRELTFIYGSRQEKTHIRVQTFGGFEVFVDGTAVSFPRQKSKELLAYLIDRRGASVTTAEACAVLFEDESYSISKRTYFRNIVKSLRDTLEKVGASEMIQKNRNHLAVIPSTFTCDYYQFLAGDPIAINAYQNDYMPSYSWAEIHNATIGFTKIKN